MPRGKALKKSTITLEVTVAEAGFIQKAVARQVDSITKTAAWPDVMPVSKEELLATGQDILDKIDTLPFVGRVTTTSASTTETNA